MKGGHTTFIIQVIFNYKESKVTFTSLIKNYFKKKPGLNLQSSFICSCTNQNSY